jgi:phosphoglucosamine mutase
VGDRYVLEEMQRTGASLGGEQSGHVIFGNYNTTGDGPLSALMVIKAMKSSGKKLSELADIMQIYPQVLKNVRVKDKETAMNNVKFLEAIKEAETKLGDRGRILVRPSGTESLIRIMAEGESIEEIEKIVKKLSDIVV